MKRKRNRSVFTLVHDFGAALIFVGSIVRMEWDHDFFQDGRYVIPSPIACPFSLYFLAQPLNMTAVSDLRSDVLSQFQEILIF